MGRGSSARSKRKNCRLVPKKHVKDGRLGTKDDARKGWVRWVESNTVESIASRLKVNETELRPRNKLIARVLERRNKDGPPVILGGVAPWRTREQPYRQAVMESTNPVDR